MQKLEPIFDPEFSESSFGFRPGRSAHDALRQGQGHVEEGRVFVVDLDVEKFFDRVNHDVLMSRVARRVDDKRVLGLIRRFLTAGLMADGACHAFAGRKERRRGDRYLRCWPTSFWMTWTRSWSGGGTASVVMPMT